MFFTNGAISSFASTTLQVGNNLSDDGKAVLLNFLFCKNKNNDNLLINK